MCPNAPGRRFLRVCAGQGEVPASGAMRRGTLVAGLTAATLLAGVAPAGAAPRSCTLPKGVYTADAQFQYATYLFTGEASDSLSALGGSLAHPSDRPRMERALANVSRGNGSRTLAYAGATARYAGAVSIALATEPPTCS